MLRYFPCIAFLLAPIVLPAQHPEQETAEHRQIKALFERQEQVQVYWHATLSPDAQQVAWSVWGPGGVDQSIYVANLKDPRETQRITAAAGKEPCHDSEPVWSHDSRQLAFLSDCRSPGQKQLYREMISDHQLHALTHLAGYLSHPSWSSDDTRVAFLFVEQASRTPNPMAAEDRAVGVIDDLVNRDVERLRTVALQTGEQRSVSPSHLYVFEYDWSPDGASFAYTAAPPPGDDNWYIARLYTQQIAAAQPKLLYKPRFQMALPRWSPDGKSIAFIEGLMSDQGGTGGEIYRIAVSGSAPNDLTPGCKSTPAWFTWLNNNEMLLTQFQGGSTAIAQLNTATGTTQKLWTGPETIRAEAEETSLSVSEHNGKLTAALVRNSWSMLPEVWAGPIGRWKQITHGNEHANLPLPRFENVEWQNEGFSVQGWLLFPQNYDPAKRYPLLMAVHGGPAWIATPEWRAPDFDTTLFTNFDYFVFFPNARGSYGQGEKFTQANRRDWGFGDLRDMLAGIDEVEKRHPIDNRRIGLLGWSYGGSTAMIAITQTHRFRAAVAGAGAGNWQSYYGQNSIDRWMLSYFGASAYDDPAAYARVSALTYIKNARTPTLVLVGERDGEAPPAQSFEFWHALKELGVPTKLVVYAGEGHSFYKAEDRIDVMQRTLDWFRQYMPPQ